MWLCRVGWLVLIWAASVTAMGLAAFFFRLVMSATGLTLSGEAVLYPGIARSLWRTLT
jgi:hypothetical protein